MSLDSFDCEFLGLDLTKSNPLENLDSNTDREDRYRLEITLNYPRTAKFLRMTELEQKAHYRNWIDDSLEIYKGRIEKADIFFEKCRSGLFHVHMSITMVSTKTFYIFGLISDVVKEFVFRLPKRYAKFDVLNYNCLFRRYRCPSICIQYVEGDDQIRCLHWEAYIRKDQQ